jgi:Haem-NO-binding
MYGIINLTIQGIVTDLFGADAWNRIKQKGNIKEGSFLSDEPYDSNATYELAGRASEVLNLSLSQLLMVFGEYWILKIANEKYRSLMKAGGSNIKEFLVNLPDFHSRVMLMYPKITPVEFRVTNETESSLHIHYFSSRKGLASFIQGLLQGLGKVYNVKISIELIRDKKSPNDHDVFFVKW